MAGTPVAEVERERICACYMPRAAPERHRAGAGPQR